MKLIIAIISFLFVSSSLMAQDALELFRQKKYDEAVAVTLKEIDADSNNLDAYSVLGWSLNAGSKFSETVDRVKKAWTTAKNNEDRRIAGVLAEAYFGLGQDLPALEYYQYFVSWGSADPNWDRRNLRDAYHDMGEIFIRIKEYSKADIALSACAANDTGRSAYPPEKASVLWSRLGYAREMTGNKASARIAYQAAIDRNADNQDAKAGLERTK